jgi:hypothetical protein
MKRITVSIMLLGVLGACGGEPTVGNGYPVVDLEITVEHPERDAIVYQLSCQGDTVTVTGDDPGLDPAAACSSLADPEVMTRLIEGQPQDQICTEIYGGPDTATIVGTLDGRPVDTQIDRTNGCGIYDWDDLLGDVLPEALGVTD